MPWLIDGSNVLGAMRVDRHSDESKRALLRLVAGYARARRTRATIVFDGPPSTNFATHLGAVTVVFSGGRSADDVIAERSEQGRGWNVVTSDRGLAARVERRQVKVVAPVQFVRDAEQAASSEPDGGGDWESYFSDEKNRLKF